MPAAYALVSVETTARIRARSGQIASGPCAEGAFGVRELHVGHGGHLSDTPRDLVAIANPRLFPGLRRLDLSALEYRYPRSYPTNMSVLPSVAAIEELGRLDHVTLPALRTDDDCAAVLALLERSQLLSITVARTYRGLPTATHPRLRIGPCRLWPPDDEISGRDALTVTPPGDELALSTIVDELELRYDAMPAADRAAWDAVWVFLDGLGWDDADGNPIELPFDAATLARAAATLPDDARCAHIAQSLAALTAGAIVQVRRYWGW